MSKIEDMLISVVMPAYNASKTVGMAIESVLTQTYENIELIIIDDCSIDDTGALIKHYADKDRRIKVLRNVKNSGVSLTRKRGVEEAKGEWIAFLDSDDLWEIDKLEKQIEAQKESGAQLVFTGSRFIDAESKAFSWILHVPRKIDYYQLLKQNLISNSSVMIKKEIYQRCAVVADNIHEDFACWLNFLKEGSFAYGIDEPLLIYRVSSTSKSGNKLKAAKMNWNTYRVVGLGVLEAVYYMFWYTTRGLLKYRYLR